MIVGRNLVARRGGARFKSHHAGAGYVFFWVAHAMENYEEPFGHEMGRPFSAAAGDHTRANEANAESVFKEPRNNKKKLRRCTKVF
jgi:hypothetical protein